MHSVTFCLGNYFVRETMDMEGAEKQFVTNSRIRTKPRPKLGTNYPNFKETKKKKTRARTQPSSFSMKRNFSETFME
jgi:hypothetical protein